MYSLRLNFWLPGTFGQVPGKDVALLMRPASTTELARPKVKQVGNIFIFCVIHVMFLFDECYLFSECGKNELLCSAFFPHPLDRKIEKSV